MKKEISKSERMKQLVKSFEQKNEIIKESDNTSDDSAIIKASARLKEIARVDEWIDTHKHNKHLPNHGGVGATVNTFIPAPEVSAQKTSIATYNPNFTYLQPNEALQLCIRRTLDSGAPVSNLGFYEEVNWNLNNMGFNARMPLDIKEAIKKMVSGE